MHELSVTESLLALTLQHAQAAQAQHVTGVHVVIGQLSSVIDESVQFYWDLIASGTMAEGARLHFRRVPATFRCVDCGHTFGLSSDTLDCPACHSLRIKLAAGEELYLEALDIEPATVWLKECAA